MNDIDYKSYGRDLERNFKRINESELCEGIKKEILSYYEYLKLQGSLSLLTVASVFHG